MAAAVDRALTVSPSLVPAFPTEGLVFWDRLPVVADASTLIGDCLRLVRRETGAPLREPLLLQLSTRVPVARLFATEIVRREVERRLPEAAEKSGLPLEGALRAWRDHYAPAVSFVDIDAPAAMDDRRLRLLAEADLDDLPTGALAERLAPCLVFSSDRHLLDCGIARNDWGSLMAEAFRVGAFHAGQSGTVLFVFLAGCAVYELGSFFVDVAREAPLVAIAAAGIGIVLGYRYVTSERGKEQRDGWGALISDGWTRLGPFLARVTDSQRLLEQAAFVPDQAPSELARVSRVVATAPHPPRPSEIGERVGLSTQKVTAILRHPQFTRSEDGGALLGRRLGADER